MFYLEDVSFTTRPFSYIPAFDIYNKSFLGFKSIVYFEVPAFFQILGILPLIFQLAACTLSAFADVWFMHSILKMDPLDNMFALNIKIAGSSVGFFMERLPI